MAAPHQPDAEEILRLLKSAEKSARTRGLALLKSSFWSGLKNWAANQLPSEEDAEDVVQDVLVAIWQCAERRRIADTCSLRTFLYEIAKKKVVNWRRDRGRRIATVQVEQEEFEEVEGALRITPHVEAIYSEMLDQVAAAVQGFPTEAQKIGEVYVESLRSHPSYPTTQELMQLLSDKGFNDVDYEAVKRQATRVKNKFQEIINKYEKEAVSK